MTVYTLTQQDKAEIERIWREHDELGALAAIAAHFYAKGIEDAAKVAGHFVYRPSVAETSFAAAIRALAQNKP